MSTSAIAELSSSECYYSPLALEPDLAELVEVFVVDLPERLAEIRRYVEFEDWAEVRRLAHQLKGAGGSYGFPHLSDAAKSLEQAVKHVAGDAAERGAAGAALLGLTRACGAARSGQPQ